MINVKNVFAVALKFTLGEEGGYSNTPGDHGKATNHGVTQAEYDSWRTRQHLPVQDVKNITPNEVAALYKGDYWDEFHGDTLALNFPLVSIVLFDWAVNHGPKEAIKDLQTCVGVDDDGEIGPHTLAAINNYVSTYGEIELAHKFNSQRMAWYMQDVAKHTDQRKFLTGWTNRVSDLNKFMAGMNRRDFIDSQLS